MDNLKKPFTLPQSLIVFWKSFAFMSVEDYEELACEQLGLHSLSKGGGGGVAVGSFCIATNPDIFNVLAFKRQEQVEKIIFHDPDFTGLMSEEDQHNLRIKQAPPSLDFFLDVAETMPAFLRDYSKHEAEYKAYTQTLEAIEQMMEGYHPGITLRRGTTAYDNLAGKVVSEYQSMTGKNIHTQAATAQKSKDQLSQKYKDTQIIFYREFWDKGRYPATPSGYLQHMQEDFPLYAEMLLRDVGLSVPNEARKVDGTGSGKSELLKLLIRGDVDNDNSAVVVVDPHGDLVEQIARLKL
ncbi:helicase HerA domain-containing protein [Terasakiella pusilla]|uniref:helicase HerA domain-containing protein n=1 Tax=Terasakiella pusilla TaxID=64973 RepID=UPI003AA7F5F1